MKYVPLLALVLFLPFQSPAQETDGDTPPAFDPVRTWSSSTDSSKTFVGKATRYDGQKVTIAPKGKSPIVIPVDKLSQEDRDWLEANAEFIGKLPSEIARIQSGNTTALGKELSKVSFLQSKIKPEAKRFIVLFSASWCPPCRAEAPKVVQLYKDSIAKDPNVELILASCDRDEDSAKKWAEKESMPFPILMEKEWSKIPALEKISPRGIPTGFLLDEKGKVIAEGLPMSVYKKSGN